MNAQELRGGMVRAIAAGLRGADLRRRASRPPWQPLGFQSVEKVATRVGSLALNQIAPRATRLLTRGSLSLLLPPVALKQIPGTDGIAPGAAV